MALETVTVKSDLLTSVDTFVSSMRSVAEGGGHAPFVDGRELSSFFGTMASDFLHSASGTFTVDNPKPAISLDVIVGFVPKLVIAFNETGPVLYLKMGTYPTSNGHTLATASFVYGANVITLGAVDPANNSRTDAFSVNTAILVATEVWNYIALG